MKRQKTRRRRTKGIGFMDILTAALISCGAVLLCMAILTLLLYYKAVGDGVIGPVNAVLKILGATLAAVLAVRKGGERAALRGMLGAVLFQLLAVGSMCLFLGKTAFSWALLGDFALCALVGAAVAAAWGLLKPEKKPRPA